MNKTGMLTYQHSGNNSLPGSINSMVINVNGNGRHNSKVLYTVYAHRSSQYNILSYNICMEYTRPYTYIAME